MRRRFSNTADLGRTYARDYKPLVELARKRKLDLIAGNLPRAVAGKVASKEGSTSPFLPRTTSAPLDRYWDLFGEAMKAHPNAERADGADVPCQCAKDDAMAEAIADYLATNPHRQPLVIHCNGNFHSDYGLGTATRLAQRAPLAQTAIVSMIAVPDVAKADVTNDRKKAALSSNRPRYAETARTFQIYGDGWEKRESRRGWLLDRGRSAIHSSPKYPIQAKSRTLGLNSRGRP